VNAQGTSTPQVHAHAGHTPAPDRLKAAAGAVRSYAFNNFRRIKDMTKPSSTMEIKNIVLKAFQQGQILKKV
jgi:hypothetical protein